MGKFDVVVPGKTRRETALNLPRRRELRSGMALYIAGRRGIVVECGIARFRETSRERIIGEGATELCGTIDYFIDSSCNHPALAEGYKVAALVAWSHLGHTGRRSSRLPAAG